VDLHLRLFGGFELRLDGRPARLDSARAESLLAYLVLHRDAPVPRQRLAFLLWPDSAEAQARTNLRHVLHLLRRALPAADDLIEATQRTLRWRDDAPAWVDVVAFDAALARGDDAAAAELAGGELLEGEYDDWITEERERLRREHLGALQRLAAAAESDGDRPAALAWNERLLAADPLREETARTLIRLYAAAGDRARALRAYHACVATLDRELGVGPAPATQALYRSLLGEARPPPAPAPGQAEPLVGRDAERAGLATRWDGAVRGRAGLVLVAGEPGVGKTRLVEELRAWAAHRGAVTATARAYPAEGALAYAPVSAWLRSARVVGRLDRLDAGVRAELARLLPELGAAARHPLTPGEQRLRLFEAAGAALDAAGRPLLLVADDLHWWDRGSLQLLHYLLRTRPGDRLLVAAAYRPEETGEPLADLLAGLGRLGLVTELELAPFGAAATAALAERLGARLDADGIRALQAATGGNPLLVTEAVRGGWSPAGPVSPRVKALLEARLAALTPEALELVRDAVTVGREFTAAILAAAAERDPDDLVPALDELWRRRIVRDQGADAYDFSHDLLRQVAYDQLGPAERRRRHLRVARALEHIGRHIGRHTGGDAGRLAVHYERAGRPAEAVAWSLRAAEAAQELLDTDEAVRLLERAAGLAQGLPGPEPELAVRTAMLVPLAGRDGFDAPSLAAAHARALELTSAAGAEPSAPLLRSLAMASLSAGDFAAARRAGASLRERGGRDGDDTMLAEAGYLLGIAAFWRAEFEVAAGHFEAALAHYRPGDRRAHLVHYLLDVEIVCRSRLANTLWFLGRPAEAVAARDAALATGRGLGHLPSLGTALLFAALLAIDMGEPKLVAGYAAELGERLELQVRPVRESAEVMAGFAEVLGGRSASGLGRIRAVVDDPQAGEHAPGMGSCLLRVLMAAAELAGDDRAARDAAERTLAMGDAAVVWAPEARRVLGTPAERPRNARS
jgi:DNA-binding SARP family transcriptional activator